jgi:hypothetical protein
VTEDACAEMAQTAQDISAQHPGWSGHDFLVEFAWRIAGISRGRMAAVGLLVGGRSRLRGGGFRPELRDRTAGQTRHFAGVARAVTVLGPGCTRWLSVHVRRDAAGTPDGRLTDLAVEFASGLLDGSLAKDRAGDWIREHLCG